MTRYIGCMLCGVGKAEAKFEKCMEEVRAAGITWIPQGFDDHTHIWTEMVVAPEGVFGTGLLDAIER